MAIKVEDLENERKFTKILEISYNDLIHFIFDHIKKRSFIIIIFWFACIISLILAIFIRINISDNFRLFEILLHSFLGLIIFPIFSIPVHELLHLIPFYISGAKNIRVGMDLKQYLFYVTAHRYVASPLQFKIVAVLPFLIISIITLFLFFNLPGLWKWSMSLFLFIHTTMCSGDFALLNFYFLNRNKKIYTWDDADKKIAYFYEKIETHESLG